MRIKTAGWIALAILVAAPAGAETSASLRMQLNLGNAPPPPAVFFDNTPPLVVVPRTTVYVVRHDRDSDRDYDFFRYGVYWYIWNDGYWYRARSYRGPFSVIHPRYVPAAIIKVPSKHWRHHPHGGPPGLQKKSNRDRYVVVREKRGHRHGREDD